MQIKVLSVSEVTQYIKRIISNDPILYNLRIKGEISNYKYHSSGHIYFTLKDQYSKINCVMFKGNSEKIKFSLEEGLKVTIKGYVSLYERDGQYQLYVNEIEPMGIGALYLAYQQLKDQLEKEGLFDPTRKKAIPFLPTKIALITSPTGAALQDMVSVIKRRFDRIELLVIPVIVQGEKATDSLVKAIGIANTFKDIDLIITGRGGGSIEELWAFNEEAVARAIAQSKIPIISAVGHETDFTIADFVADLRAPTPSVAAELAVPSYLELKEVILCHQKRLLYLIESKLISSRNQLAYAGNSYPFRYPLNQIYNHRHQLDDTMINLIEDINLYYRDKKKHLERIGARLNDLSPLSVIKRGFCYGELENRHVLKSVEQVKPSDLINLWVSDGKLQCKVVEVVKEGEIFEEKEF